MIIADTEIEGNVSSVSRLAQVSVKDNCTNTKKNWKTETSRSTLLTGVVLAGTNGTITVISTPIGSG